MNPEATCFYDNETIWRQKLIPAAKSLQMLTRDFEMIQIFVFAPELFRFFPAWGVSSGMEYSTLTSCCFTPAQLPYIWKISVKDSPTSFMTFVTSKSFGLNRCMTSFPAGPFRSIEASFLSGLSFQSPDWRVGCPFLSVLISSDMDGRSRYVARVCHFLSASRLDLRECCAPILRTISASSFHCP